MPRKRKFHIPVLLLALTLVAGNLWRYLRQSDSPSNSALCVRVIDGDTLQLAGGDRVRLIGVDTPESVHPNHPQEYFGKQAAAFTRRLTEGKQVNLEFGSRERDAYGRLLAYVFLADGTFVNSEIIRLGYGFAYTRFPFRYEEEFRRLQREARKHRRGLWAR
jgi:micrococcal nuclease